MGLCSLYMKWVTRGTRIDVQDALHVQTAENPHMQNLIWEIFQTGLPPTVPPLPQAGDVPFCSPCCTALTHRPPACLSLTFLIIATRPPLSELTLPVRQYASFQGTESLLTP